MDNNRVKELEEIEKRFKARNKYNTDYQKNNYDRTVILLDKGQKKIVDDIAKNKGFKSITEYVKHLIKKDQEENNHFQDASIAATLPGAEEPEPIKPEPIKDPYKGIGWEGDPLPFE